VVEVVVVVVEGRSPPSRPGLKAEQNNSTGKYLEVKVVNGNKG